MAFREVRVFEVREILRLWLRGEGLRAISRLAGMDRKTVRRYVEAAEELGLDRAGDDDQLTDLLLGQVVERVRPHRTDGRGEARRLLDAHRGQLEKWLDDDGLHHDDVDVTLDQPQRRCGPDHPRRMMTSAAASPHDSSPSTSRRTVMSWVVEATSMPASKAIGNVSSSQMKPNAAE